MTIASASDPANGTVVLTGGSAGAHTGLTYQPDSELLRAGHVHVHAQRRLDRRPCRSPSRASTTRRRRSTTARPWSRTPAPRAIDVLANDTDTDGGRDGRVGDAAGERHGGDHRRRERADVSADRRTTAADRTASRTRSTAATRRPCRSPSRVSTIRRRRSTTPRRSPRTRPRPRSTCWPTTPTSTAGPSRSTSVTQSTNGTVVDHRWRHGPDVSAQPRLLQRPARDHARRVHVHAQRRLDRDGVGHGHVHRRSADAVDDSATVAEDSGASAIDVLANDTDTDGGPRSVASVTQPANGTVVITGGGSGLTYQPNPNYCNSQAGGAPDTLHVHAQRRRLGHRVGHRDVCRRSADGGRRQRDGGRGLGRGGA